LLSQQGGYAILLFLQESGRILHGRVVMLVMLVNEHTLSAGEMGE
jgi:hypothetical protein